MIPTPLTEMLAMIPLVATASVEAARTLLSLATTYPINLVIALSLAGWAFARVRGLMIAR